MSLRAFPKPQTVRSEAYRRAVASLACIHCGRPGPTQAAHPSTGRGGAMKTDDRRCFPLCAPRIGDMGCHARFDQGALFPKQVRREVEQEWTRRTQLLLLTNGLWPAGVPAPADLEIA